MNSRRKESLCLNCGIIGHTSKFCNAPTISCGVISFKRLQPRCIEYLMIQRKDSLCYVEFLRGNYDLKNKNYIIELFNKMTEEEKERLRFNTFDVLWNGLWVDNKRNHSNYRYTRDKFNKLKHGFYLRNKESIIFVNLETLLDMSNLSILEQEWDFPKGRRKLGEKDWNCALREFQEESNVSHDDIIFCEPYKHFEEIYLSNNKVRYKNIYFIAEYINKKKSTLLYDLNNINQTKEVRDVKWFSYEEVLLKLINRHFEKTELFKLVHINVLRNINKNNKNIKNFYE